VSRKLSCGRDRLLADAYLPIKRHVTAHTDSERGRSEAVGYFRRDRRSPSVAGRDSRKLGLVVWVVLERVANVHPESAVIGTIKSLRRVSFGMPMHTSAIRSFDHEPHRTAAAARERSGTGHGQRALRRLQNSGKRSPRSFDGAPAGAGTYRRHTHHAQRPRTSPRNQREHDRDQGNVAILGVPPDWRPCPRQTVRRSARNSSDQFVRSAR
jgi:hypothetical protein